MNRKVINLFVVAIAFAVIVGCGSSSPFDYVKASGKVTFEDGTPLTVGQVVFQPLAESKGESYPRAGVGHLGDNGTFGSVTSYKPGDGLIRGEHKVAIMYAFDENGKPLVPKEYTNVLTSPLLVDTSNLPFEITIPHP